MKIRTLALAAGCALAAACGGPPPASSGPASGLDLRLDPPPVHALIGLRADLGLSSEQIEALDEVGQQIHADNNPLLGQLVDLRRNSDNVVIRRELVQTASRIHTNNHRAMEQVRGVLTEQQRTTACTLFAGSTGSTRGLRTVESENATHLVRQTTTQLQLGSFSQNGPVWTWCSEDLTTTATR